MSETMVEEQETGTSSSENETLLKEYAAKQKEVAMLIRERENLVGGLSPISMSEPIRTEKIEKEYGSKVAAAFAELHGLQKKLDDKGLKAPTMEERGM